MADNKVIGFSEMREMQLKLQELHKGDWAELDPEQARNQLLYMVEEVGEVIAIAKKKGDDAIMNDPAVRANFITEFSDVLMYLNDVLICYDISPEEISIAFRKKHAKNMKRNWVVENSNKFETLE
ncbi:MAG: DUF550 domain-containing protein [Clostridia bacterium]|nr:DUF550 domain-containing protein [Clostridia bacterium]